MAFRCNILTLLVGLTGSLILAACTSDVTPSEIETGRTLPGLRSLTHEERLADFDGVAQSVLNYYGPLSYKERRFQFKATDLIAEYREKVKAASSDEEAFGVTKKFLARFQDGHISLISLLGPSSVMSRYTVPLNLKPVQGRAVVSEVMDATLTTKLGIEVGDEVVLVDGVPSFEYLKTLRQYESFGNEVSDQHLMSMILQRPTYMTELRPSRPSVEIVFEKADGTRMKRSLIWAYNRDQVYFESGRVFPGLGAMASAANEDAEKPFFVTEQTQRDFNITRVTPSEAMLRKHGLTVGQATPALYAALMSFQGKNVLLMRISHYMPMDPSARIAWYKATLEEYGPFAQALILDQTNNPGGSIEYALDFVSLFANQNTRGLVSFFHPDRLWLRAFAATSAMSPDVNGIPSEFKNVQQLAFKVIEDAYDKNLELTEVPVPLMGFEYIKPQGVGFKKPVLMLVNENSGSCGDLVPMLLKENKLAKIFGERTMGLGGNVSPVYDTPYFAASLNLTRGLYTVFAEDGVYDMDRLTENNGVAPDIHYTPTLKDMRAGYSDYVNAFLKAAFEEKP